MCTKAEYERLFKSGRKTIGDHEPLVALSLGVDVGDYDADWEEIVYTVPYKWLKDSMPKIFGVNWGMNRLRKWLREEYVSEDSDRIFERAYLERQLVTMNID